MEEKKENSLQEAAMNEIQQMDMMQILGFVYDMFASYPTEKLIEFRDDIISSGNIESKEEMLLVIEEILRVREQSEKN